METGTEQPQNIADRLATYGPFLSAALALLTVVTPVFGETGLVRVLPLPEDYSSIGPSVASFVSFVVAVATFLAFSRREADSIPWVGAVSGFVVALVLLAVYLSWVEGNRVTDINPLWIVPGGVVVMFVYTAAVAAMASTFAFLGVAFLQTQSSQVQAVEPAVEQEKVEREVTPEKVENVNIDYSIEMLAYYVFRAEWDFINDVARDGPRTGYWRLYYHIASSLTSPYHHEKRKSLGKAHSWSLVLAALTKVLPKAIISDKDLRLALDQQGNQMIEGERRSDRVTEKLSKPGLTVGVEMFGFAIERFILIPVKPHSYGLDRMYFDIKQSLGDSVRLYGQLDDSSQSALRFAAALDTSELDNLIERMQSPSTDPEAREPLRGFYNFWRDVRFDLIKGNMYGPATGVLAKIRIRAMSLGEKMTTKSSDLPDATVAKSRAERAAALAYCVAAAATAIERKAENIDDYTVAMRRLHEFSVSWHQGLPACRLASEYREGARSLMQAGGEQDGDAVEEVERTYSHLVEKAGETRGVPCPR
jgi:hypothetical protein